MIKVTLITILSIQVLIFSILLFFKKDNRLTNSLLGLVLLFFGFTTINFSIFQGLLYEQLLTYIPYLRLELLYALGPSIYLYTKSVTNSEFKLKKLHLLLFIPALLEFIYYRTSFYREGANPIDQDATNLMQQLFNIQQWFGVFYSSFFMSMAIYIFFKYRNWLYNNYSFTKNISLQWIHVPILCFVIFWFIWFSIRLSDVILFSGKYGELYFYPMYILLSLIALWIGFKGYTSSRIGAVGFNNINNDKEKVSKQNILQHKQIVDSLLEKMKLEKYYLDQDLSLKILSDKTGIQKDLLSKSINQHLKINFHEFVNRYRVEDFIKRIEKDKTKEFTFLAHAYDSGFSSKSSFNYVFKKFTKRTPKEYFSDLHKKS